MKTIGISKYQRSWDMKFHSSGHGHGRVFVPAEAREILTALKQGLEDKFYKLGEQYALFSRSHPPIIADIKVEDPSLKFDGFRAPEPPLQYKITLETQVNRDMRTIPFAISDLCKKLGFERYHE